MAPLPIINNVFRCAVQSSSPGSGYAISVFHVHSSTLEVPEIGPLMATRVADGNSPWTNLMSTSATTDSIAVTPLDGSTATAEFPITGGAGLVTGNAIVAANPLVSWRTGVRGPKARGRTYIPFTGEGGTNGGFLDSGTQAQAQMGVNAWFGDLPDEGVTLVVASYVHSSFQPVTSALVELPLATQRRRQDRLRAS